LMNASQDIFQLNQPTSGTENWMLDPQVVFLNHGSFGSCPRSVLAYQRQLSDRLERQPVKFLVRELEPLLDEARTTLAEFLGAKADNLVFVQNATAGVNTVLRSLRFHPGDELLVTNQEYNACRNAINFVADQFGAKVVVADVPFPFKTAADLIEPILRCVTPRTKIALVDHVTCETGMIMPIPALLKELSARGVDTLVDGAHTAGMVPLNLEELGAAYYTGNCHKWLCAPKTVAFLHVRPDKQQLIRPLSISHGANSRRTDRSRFLIEFAWTGTGDHSPALCVPAVLKAVRGMMPGGWPEVMARNHALALAGRKIICDALNIPLPCPDEFIGSMASIPLPDNPPEEPPAAPFFINPLQNRLLEKHNIEVPIMIWPALPKRLVRISAQLYNSLAQYEVLAEALKKEL
jgi:isopenicillin-N epimerase